MINVQRTSNGIEDEINRLADGPTLIDFEKFENVLVAQYAATQTAVHVQTGSLKLSGQVSSNTNLADRWEGSISYGGESAGIHNPVDYAEFERERDGNHDFLQPAKAMDHYYEQAMKAFLGG
jgi:hypothetical protein